MITTLITVLTISVLGSLALLVAVGAIALGILVTDLIVKL